MLAETNNGFLGKCPLCQASDAAISVHGAQEEAPLPTALPSGAKVLLWHFCSQLTPAFSALQLQLSATEEAGLATSETQTHLQDL